MKSKENLLLKAFFNSPKFWRFKDLLNEVDITRPQLSRWLKLFERFSLIKKIKQKNKMPYYLSNQESLSYFLKKKEFAFNEIKNSGLFEYIFNDPNINTAILFGSFSRSDWHKDSDIDLFLFGNFDNFDKSYFEKKLGREIQLFPAKTKKDLRKYNEILPHIIEGEILKGSLQDLGLTIYA